MILAEIQKKKKLKYTLEIELFLNNVYSRMQNNQKCPTLLLFKRKTMPFAL